jgi:hypothetical protein
MLKKKTKRWIGVAISILILLVLAAFQSRWQLTLSGQPITTQNRSHSLPARSHATPEAVAAETNAPPTAQPQPSPVMKTTNTPKVDSDRLWQSMQALVGERFTATQRQQTRAYLKQELQAAGWSSQEIPFSGGINLIAHRPGTNPRAGTLLVGAHYDTVAGSPGADDNASGVATVVEIARLMGDRSSPRGLTLAFFDLEEQGLKGSAAFANDPEQIKDLAGVVVLEMVGYRCQTPGCQRKPKGLMIALPSDRGDFLVVVGDVEHQPLLHQFHQAESPNLPAVLTLPTPFKGVLTPDLLRSDHAPFWLQDIGAVMVTDTANFRNPHYHQPSDTLETIDRDFLDGAAQIVTNTISQLLQGDKSLATPKP